MVTMTTYPTHRPRPLRILMTIAVAIFLLPSIVRDFYNAEPTDEV